VGRPPRAQSSLANLPQLEFDFLRSCSSTTNGEDKERDQEFTYTGSSFVSFARHQRISMTFPQDKPLYAL
jgi:hypothetical protein